MLGSHRPGPELGTPQALILLSPGYFPLPEPQTPDSSDRPIGALVLYFTPRPLSEATRAAAARCKFWTRLEVWAREGAKLSCGAARRSGLATTSAP